MKISQVWTSLINISSGQSSAIDDRAPSHRRSNTAVRLNEYVTLIRGDNGTGKTIIAEVMSLLGHASILGRKPLSIERGIPLATLEVSLSKNDVEFLELLNAFVQSTSGMPFVVGGVEWALSRENAQMIKSVFRSLGPLDAIPQADTKVLVEFWKVSPSTPDIPAEDRFDLKKILANDHLLRRHLELRCVGSNGEDFCTALQWLVAWNRPTLLGAKPEEGPWSVTPRFVLSQSVSTPSQSNDLANVHPPGPVGYLNTDMYDFGAGIDIRESPKELRSHMTTTLVDRLQVVDQIGVIETGLVSDSISLSGQKYPVMNLAMIEEGWARLFGTEDEGFADAQPLKTSHVQSLNGRLTWCESDNFQEFVSSGENQAFFLLCYLATLHRTDSILILDEPELHLSIRAASRMVKEIVRLAHDRGSQIVIVTHLPHLYYQVAVDEDKYDLIYMQRKKGGDEFVRILEGEAAFQAASQDSHIQVDNLVQNLRSEPAPSIYFWLTPIKQFLEGLGLFQIRRRALIAVIIATSLAVAIQWKA